MNGLIRITSRFAGVVAVAVVVGTSAFADTRHPKTTKPRDEGRADVVGRANPAVASPDGPLRDASPRAADANRTPRVRGGNEPGAVPVAHDDKGTYGRGRGHNSHDQYGEKPRGRDRYEARGTRGSDVHTGKSALHYSHGRVSKVRPHGEGYRVWISGSPHPYYVPHAYWRPGDFSVGLTVSLGGYYNPRGWYDYYGDYECAANPGERLRGIVENVDYGRGLMLLDLARGGYATIDLRGRHEGTRPGDYVVVYGDWNRWGRFVAYDVDVIDRAYRW